MTFIHRIRRVALAIVTGAAIAIGVLSAPIVLGALTPAAAQISEDAQIALEQYGSWRPHPRFGDVWVPGAVPPDWRPYEYGHWVYTDDWGWYWVPTMSRRTGAGLFITMVVGHSNPESVGSGYRVRNGRRLG